MLTEFKAAKRQSHALAEILLSRVKSKYNMHNQLACPYGVADDVDCAGLLWGVLEDDDPLREEALLDVVKGGTHPVMSWLDELDLSLWTRPLAGNEFPLHGTHHIGHVRGLRLLWKLNAEAKELAFLTIFPVATFKEPFEVKFTAIECTADGAQARVAGALVVDGKPKAALSFFMSDWYLCRRLIQPGDVNTVGLGIWAFAIRPAETMRWEIPTEEWIVNKPPEVLEMMGKMLKKRSVTVVGDELRTVYGPVHEGGRDDLVNFRGQVVSCRKLRTEMMAWSMWDVLVNLLDINGRPVLMKVVVTEAALEGAYVTKTLKRGDWVEGHGWMQGNLLALGKRKQATAA